MVDVYNYNVSNPEAEVGSDSFSPSHPELATEAGMEKLVLQLVCKYRTYTEDDIVLDGANPSADAEDGEGESTSEYLPEIIKAMGSLNTDLSSMMDGKSNIASKKQFKKSPKEGGGWIYNFCQWAAARDMSLAGYTMEQADEAKTAHKAALNKHMKRITRFVEEIYGRPAKGPQTAIVGMQPKNTQKEKQPEAEVYMSYTEDGDIGMPVFMFTKDPMVLRANNIAGVATPEDPDGKLYFWYYNDALIEQSV